MNQTYQEKVFNGLLAILPGGVGVAMLGVFIYDRLSGSFEDPSTPWFFLGTGLFLLLVAINFAFLTVSVSSRGVSARFGLLSHHIPADNIAGFYEDKASSVSYGGFGIRFGSVNGKYRLVYNVASAPRVVVQHRRESNREFVFSTRNPAAVMKALKEISAEA